jgi:hypothetical protein
MTQRYPMALPPAAYIPAYVPVITYNGGLFGDDVSVATSNATQNYGPRNQAAKGAAMVPAVPLAVAVSRRRGWIAPNQSYIPGTIPAAPVITSLSPNTAVAGTGAALVVDIVGTGFSPWSLVTSGNYPIPFEYISPTLLRIAQFPRNSIAGIVTVQVYDHNVLSNTSDFTFT